MNHIVLFSGGLSSFEVAYRVIEEHGLDSVDLLFTDTRQEDEDLYRFLIETTHLLHGSPGKPEKLLKMVSEIPPLDPLDSQKRVNAIALIQEKANKNYPRLRWVAEGRDLWTLFRDEKFIGNTRADNCSRELKRDLSKAYVGQYPPEDCLVYLGIGWTEIHRYDRAIPGWEPYKLLAPLTEDFEVTNQTIGDRLASYGIEIPRLYKLGFPHNNCGGFCVKAGLAHFKLLKDTLPEVYAYHEAQERLWQEATGKPNTILRLQRKPKAIPLTLTEFRDYAKQKWPEEESEDFGGCGCMLG